MSNPESEDQMIGLHEQKLGRLPSPYDARTLWLSDYVKPELPPQPDKRYWQLPIKDWGVMGNDSYGNCVIVTAAHAILSWRANELADTQRLTDSAVIELSRQMGALNGYNILERLKYWRKIGMWSDKLWAFAAVVPADFDQIKIAINMFGLADIGVNMPNAWRGSDTWDTGNGASYRPGSWGGHSIPIVGYDPDFLYVASWGEIIRMTWAALSYYCDEAYALIDSNWLAKDAITPSGFDLPQLHADLQLVANA
jgi:hypothetical protein